MIERKTLVIRGPVDRLWLVRMVERGAHTPGGIEAARDSNVSNRIEAVSILEDASFQTGRRHTRRIAVALDRAGNDIDPIRLPLEQFQRGPGLICGQRGSARTERGIFRDLHSVMEQYRGGEDLQIPALYPMDDFCVPPYPLKVRQIVSSVLGRWEVALKLEEEFVMGAEGFLDHRFYP